MWEDGAGLAWTDPYDKRVWKYNVDVAAAAARAGFDEILFDYVRFPSDGDVGSTVYSNPQALAKRDAVPSFLRYARSRLEPLGVACRRPCSASPAVGISGSGSSRGAWRRTWTRSIR